MVEYVKNLLSDKQKQEVWEILCECDNEFLPPLSSRNSTSQKQLNCSLDRENTPRSYFNEMICQDFILAAADDHVAGFLTFKKAYSCPALESFGESLYITTVCVRHDQRGKGLLTSMYKEVEHTAGKLGYSGISTRTWSQNHKQIHTLRKLGYNEITIIQNDRGKGIDTIYMGKHLSSQNCHRKPV